MSNPDTAGATGARVNKLYFAAWRWHFYAAILVVPILLMLTVTGAIMMISLGTGNQLGHAGRVQPGGPALAPSALIAAATEALPGAVPDQYVAPEAPDRAAYVVMKQDGRAMAVALNPYDGAVLNLQDKKSTLYAFANKIHGTLLIGDTGDRIIEAAASLTILMIVTGLYIWWPRQGGGLARMLIPDLSARGRALWKSLHGTIGTWMSLALLGFCLSGLAWAGIWGSKFVQPWSSFPIERKAATWSSDLTHADLGHGIGGEVPWGLEQTPLPVSGDSAGRFGVDDVALWAAQNDYSGQYKLSLPKGETGVFTLSVDGRNEDGVLPSGDRTVHFDRYSGAVLADIGYADYSVMAKVMAWGIGLHKGMAGIWNFVLNLVILAMIALTCVTGVVMWWKRRPGKAGRLAAPPVPVDVPLAKGVVLIALALAMALPMLGITLLAVLALDLILLSRVPALKRALS